MKKKIAMALTAVMLLSAVGCGAKTESTDTAAKEPAAAQETQEAEAAAQETPESTDAPQAAEEKKESAIKEYAGAYSDENGTGIYLLFEEAEDPDAANVTIGYPQQTAYTYWEIYGKIEGNTITYKDASKYSMDWGTPDQEEVQEEQIYKDGTGIIEISEDRKVTWKDDKEDAGKGIVFAWDEELNAQMQEQMQNAELEYEGGQNPVMNWAGPYADSKSKSRTMMITSGSEGTSDCTVTVTESGSEDKKITWTMSGTFDEASMSIRYTGCVKKEAQVDESGKVLSEETVYEDGTGSFNIQKEDQTITWTDDKENAGEGSVFTFRYDYGDRGTGEGETAEEAAEEPVEAP